MQKPDLIWETRFENKGPVDWMILEGGGIPFLRLPPGREHTIISADAEACFWARFSYVRRNADGTTTIEMNKTWPRPASWEGRRTIIVTNLDGQEHECLRVDEIPVHCYRGIPTEVPVSTADNQNVFFKSITLRLFKEKMPDPENPAFIKTVTKLRWVREPRDPEEVRVIAAELKELYAKEGMKNVRFPREVESIIKETKNV